MKLSDREQTLVSMLEVFNDVRDLLDRSNDLAYGGAPGSVALQHSKLFTNSFRELERCLYALRAEEPGLYHALAERYLRSVRRRRFVRRRAGRFFLEGNEQVVGVNAELGYRENFAKTWEGWVTVVTWRSGTDLGRVRQAVGWLSNRFQGAPCLPSEMIGSVAA